MPTIQHRDATIYYEEFGSGFPILTFAPAGLSSTIKVWSQPSAAINPTVEFAGNYRVIAMDQRNAGGQSHAPMTAETGWDSYTADHIAILDHLGIDKCHLYGQCIGGPFILNMLKAQPDRIVAAVIAQPIGHVGATPPQPSPRFLSWAAELKDHPEATRPVVEAMFHNLYGRGFAYSVDRDFVRQCRTPCIVLAGNDEAHPFAYAEELASLLPDSEFIPEWKSGADLTAARSRIEAFLAEHTPAR